MHTVLIYLHTYFWPLSPVSGSRLGVVAGQVKPSLYSAWALSAHSISPLNLREQNDLQNSILLLFPCPHAPLTLQAGQCLCVSDGLGLDKGTYHQAIYLFSDGGEPRLTQFPKLYSKTWLIWLFVCPFILSLIWWFLNLLLYIRPYITTGIIMMSKIWPQSSSPLWTSRSQMAITKFLIKLIISSQWALKRI